MHKTFSEEKAPTKDDEKAATKRNKKHDSSAVSKNGLSCKLSGTHNIRSPKNYTCIERECTHCGQLHDATESVLCKKESKANEREIRFGKRKS